MEAVANLLAAARKVFRKAAIVGCSKKNRRAFEKSLQAANISYPVAFFRDFEKAKEWLIYDADLTGAANMHPTIIPHLTQQQSRCIL